MSDLVCPFCGCGIQVNDGFPTVIECVGCGAAWDSRGVLLWSNIAPLAGDFE